MDHKESFLQYLLVEKRYSKHTVISYRNDLGQFFAFLKELGHTGRVEDVYSGEVRAWIVRMMDGGISAASVHRKISCLRIFYKWLRKEGVAGHNPMEKVVLPRRKKKLPVFVGEESLDNLLDKYDFGGGFAGIRNRTIIEMLYLTGMRRAELIGLRKSDVDTGSGLIKVTGKRNKQRIIPLLGSFTGRLNEYITGRGARGDRA